MNNASANSVNAAPAETMSWAALNFREELAEAGADMSWIGLQLSQHHVEPDEAATPPIMMSILMMTGSITIGTGASRPVDDKDD